MDEIQNYKDYLNQVTVSLSLDPDNQELLDLKKHLEEAIALCDDIKSAKQNESALKWNKGDECQAMWAGDKHFYNAIIEDIYADGTCQVRFNKYTDKQICDLSSLKLKLAEEKMSNKVRQRKRHKNKMGFEEYKAKRLYEKKMFDDEINSKVEAERQVWKSFNTKIKKKKNNYNYQALRHKETINQTDRSKISIYRAQRNK